MKIEKLFFGESDKFRAAGFSAGDIVPFRNQYYLMDVENFHFEEIDDFENRINRQKVKNFLDAKKVSIPVDDFIVLWIFQRWLRVTYPECGKYQSMRGEVLSMMKNSAQNPTPLSVAFAKKIVMCTETSALAQMYLQHRGIKSVLYSGNVIDNPNEDIKFGGGAHAWVMVELGGQKYFYDPANPIVMDKMLLPAIMDYSALSKSDKDEFEKIIHQSSDQGGGFAYIEAIDVYGAGRRWLYGFQCGDNQRRVESAVKRQAPKQSQQMQSSRGRA